MTQDEFARRLGVTRGAVGNWERDQGIKTENLSTISEIFRVPIDWLVRGGDELDDTGPHVGAFHLNEWLKSVQARRARAEPYEPPMRDHVPIVGEVAAGAWVDPDEMDEPRVPQVFVPPDPRYSRNGQRAWVVRGHSVEKTARDGQLLVGVLVGEDIEPKDGDLVIAERRREQGALIERTAKRLRLFRKHAELVPEYLDDALNKPLRLAAPDSQDDDTEVRILAVVVGVYNPLRR